MHTLLLDVSEWDIILDARGNIAVAAEPYALAQDAASAIKTFAGEVYFDSTLGIPYLSQLLGKNPPLGLIKALFVAAAQTVPGVGSAACFLTSITDRRMTGQVQVTSATTGQVSAASFEVVNPQGI